MEKHIPNRVKEIRESLGLTTTDVADRAGCSQGEVTHVENFDKVPNQETISKLIKGLGIPPHKVHKVFNFNVDKTK